MLYTLNQNAVFYNNVYLLYIQDISFNTQRKIVSNEDDVVLKKDVRHYGLSDDENVLPLSKNNTREEHVENGEKMVCNHMISQRAYLFIFFPYEIKGEWYYICLNCILWQC